MLMLRMLSYIGKTVECVHLEESHWRADRLLNGLSWYLPFKRH